MVTSALVRLRDQSEQRIVPACQRLYLALEEVLGWSGLPGSYELCQFTEEEVRHCLDMISQAIIASSWLSTVARRELARFREFMKWLRFEINNASAPSEHVLQPNHDVLEVCNYIVNGLVDSSIDKWFTGEAPEALTLMSTREVKGQPECDLTDVMEHVRQCLSRPEQEISLERPVSRHDLHRADRNLHTLLHNLADECSTFFQRASESTARSTSCRTPPRPQPPKQSGGELIIRERSIVGTNKGQLTQYLVMYQPTADSRMDCLCIFRLQHGQENYVLSSSIVECSAVGSSGHKDYFDLLDLDFFDDECFVVVYRGRGQAGQVGVAAVRYSELGYEELEEGVGLHGLSREGIAWDAIRRWQTGAAMAHKAVGTAMEVTRSCTLSACQGDGVYMAVNGRTGRRVVCVLDKTSGVLEVLDLEAEEEEGEEE